MRTSPHTSRAFGSNKAHSAARYTLLHEEPISPSLRKTSSFGATIFSSLHGERQEFCDENIGDNSVPWSALERKFLALNATELLRLQGTSTLLPAVVAGSH